MQEQGWLGGLSCMQDEKQIWDIGGKFVPTFSFRRTPVHDPDLPAA